MNSTTDLIKQVKAHPDVMDRYRRHFAMSSAEVLSYLSTLHITKLDADGVYTVYGVPHASGDFHAHLRLLKKGEPVFAEQDDTAVLMLVCGNPLILGPKKPSVPNAITPQIDSSTMDMKSIQVDAAPEFSAAAPVAEAPQTGEAVIPVYGDLPNVPNPLALLVALGGAVSIVPHSGNTPPPVPEPVSLVVLGGGLAALAARTRARKAR